MSQKGPSLAARWIRLIALAVVAAIATIRPPIASAQVASPPADARGLSELARLFPREADIFVDAERNGLSFISVPLELMKESRPDLSDVRIFNPDGGEVPFLVNTSLPKRPPGAIERVGAEPIDVRQGRKRTEEGERRKHERYVIEVPETPPSTGAWDLVLSTTIEHFVRRAEIREAGEKGKSITKASIFRLVSPLRERTRIPLPPGIKGRIELSIESEDDDTTYLEPTMAFEAAIARSAATTAVVPLVEVSRTHTQGRTILTLARPRGFVPSALRIETSTPTFYRPIEVSDDGVGHTAGRLVSAPVYRVEAMPQVAELEIPISGAQGDRLHVEVVDADSPELTDLRVLAIVARPSLIFSLAPGAGKAPAGTLRFGGGRAHRPSYDLEGLRSAMSRSDAERLADHLQDPREVPEAKLGEIRQSSIFDPSPALSFAMHPAAEIDLGGYSSRATLRAAEAPEGVSRTSLTPEVLAAARSDLGDLRVVDAQNKQWPYLLEEAASTTVLKLDVSAPQRKERRSRYAIRLPASPLFIAELALDIPADYLERDYRLTGRAEGGQDLPLMEGRLMRRPGEPRSLTLALPKTRVASLELIVEDGDDAPLDVRGAEATITLPDLYLVAPAGTYTLLAGQPSATAPHYELAAARDLVLSVSAPVARMGALEQNPKFVQKPAPTFVESYALWGALALAVVVLGALTLRLAHSEGKAAEAPKAGASEETDAPEPTAAPAAKSKALAKAEAAPKAESATESATESDKTEAARTESATEAEKTETVAEGEPAPTPDNKPSE